MTFLWFTISFFKCGYFQSTQLMFHFSKFDFCCFVLLLNWFTSITTVCCMLPNYCIAIHCSSWFLFFVILYKILCHEHSTFIVF